MATATYSITESLAHIKTSVGRLDNMGGRSWLFFSLVIPKDDVIWVCDFPNRGHASNPKCDKLKQQAEDKRKRPVWKWSHAISQWYDLKLRISKFDTVSTVSLRPSASRIPAKYVLPRLPRYIYITGTDHKVFLSSGPGGTFVASTLGALGFLRVGFEEFAQLSFCRSHLA